MLLASQVAFVAESAWVAWLILSTVKLDVSPAPLVTVTDAPDTSKFAIYEVKAFPLMSPIARSAVPCKSALIGEFELTLPLSTRSPVIVPPAKGK